MFGHPQVPGIRAETGYWINAKGAEPFSAAMERRFGI